MSMLDLNVDIIDETSDYSSNNSSPLICDLLKKEKDVSDIITRTLFPVSADRGGRVSDSMTQNGLKILQQKKPQVRKSRRGPRSRSSQYRGVTLYRRTGRWESHIWDCGKQVYLGGFDTSHAAARAYDRAAIRFRGVDADINFIFSDYEEDLKQMKGLSKEEFVLRVRRQTNGISKRNSTFRSALVLHKCDLRVRPFVGKTFCHKPPIKRDHEVETSCNPSTTYKGGINANSNKTGNLHNLDLSLGISPSSKQPINNDSGGWFPFGWTTCMIPNERIQ